MNYDIEKLAKEASKVLSGGGVIVYPTETVYGLGGNATDELTVRKIFKIKGREEGKPLIILVKDFVMAGQIGDLGLYRGVLEKYWPGALTGIFKSRSKLPAGIVSKEGTVALRISPHPFVQKLFEFIDFPLISTSANRSGDKNSLSVTAVKNSLGENFNLIGYVIDLGELPSSLPSTLVDFTSTQPRILRQGSISFPL